MIRANDLSNFDFKFLGRGHFRVTYHTPSRGDYWINVISDTAIIDATRSAEWAKVADIRTLMRLVKRGAHYRKDGTRIG